MSSDANEPGGIIAGIVRKFLISHLSVLLMIAALILGVAAILITPREEEPQIVVPMADIFVSVPGSSPREVEQLAATPLERLLWQLDGVEYVYSVSRQDMAVVTVRFYVGENREESLIKLHNRITMNIDAVPSVVKGWVIKPVEIDDVPIVNLTLYSDRYDDHELYRIGEEVLARLAKVKNTSGAEIVGGRRREVRVELDPERMTGLGVSLLEVHQVLQGADASVTAGTFSRFNREYIVTSNSFIASVTEVGALMVGVSRGQPVYLRDIAVIHDGPVETDTYTRIGYSQAYRQTGSHGAMPESYPAVTLAIAKKKGTNAVNVARDVLNRLENLQQTIIPDDVRVEVTRNYGQTAQQKVDELLRSLGFAIITVVVLLMLTLGWKEALVVALAVPISFSLALVVNYLFGYTINRVTLFALILSLGLVVDDPITNVDNIQRHILKGVLSPLNAVLFAVKEVLPPVLMSTVAIILCFTPLFFITGMMGPYMAPMAANVPITVIFSTFCAITIVPWLTYTLLKKKQPPNHAADEKSTPQRQQDILNRVYRSIVLPLLDSQRKRWLLLFFILLLLCLPVIMVVFRMVPLKMLPFDNKNEFQLMLDMPEGTTLETTEQIVRDFEDFLQTVPEVTYYVSYIGHASPMDFNGMVRHAYLRRGGHLADIRVHLLDKKERKAQSHAIVLRLRQELTAIAEPYQAVMKLIEVPPGPPVLSTITAEIYGTADMPYEALISAGKQLKQIMRQEPFVVDIDDMAEAARDRIDFLIDKEKAALHSVSTHDIIQSLQIALSGSTPAAVHKHGERSPLMIRLILPREKRSGILSLSQIPINTRYGQMIPLAELAEPVYVPIEQPIYHKNLERVVYVMGEMAGQAPAEAILDMQKQLKQNPLPEGIIVDWAGEGEWKITLDVFRDMGIAFAAAMLGIYILLILQTNSFFMPLLIMTAIPLTLIGAMPGFWLLNLITGETVGGFSNPVFFTATSMIGMIALGGIVIRNSLVLIEFIQQAVKQGTPFQEAVLQSGAIRMRPIILTAATTALGAWPITLDPIFSGLAWCLIFGLFASTLFTLIVIPVTYYALYKEQTGS